MHGKLTYAPRPRPQQHGAARSAARAASLELDSDVSELMLGRRTFSTATDSGRGVR